MKKRVKNLEELELWVSHFLRELEKRDGATIITLSGDLGAGKTAWVKSAAKYFGITEDITSPTFVIQKEYLIEEHPFLKKFIHIDAYRLEDKAELEYLGWNELIQNQENMIFIEWPEQVEGINLDNAIPIRIKILDDDSREIEVLG